MEGVGLLHQVTIHSSGPSCVVAGVESACFRAPGSSSADLSRALDGRRFALAGCRAAALQLRPALFRGDQAIALEDIRPHLTQSRTALASIDTQPLWPT